jgi:hypothetical protein
MMCLGHAPHGQDGQLESAADHDHHDHHGSADGLDSAVGISLVLGFIFMLLVDQVSVLQNSFSLSLTAALERWYLLTFKFLIIFLIKARAYPYSRGQFIERQMLI